MTANDAPIPYLATASTQHSVGSVTNWNYIPFSEHDPLTETNCWASDGPSGSGYGSDDDPWLAFSFGEKVAVKGLRVYRNNGVNLEWLPKQATIQMSLDGSTWEDVTVYDFSDPNTTEHYDIIFDRPVRPRDIRLAKLRAKGLWTNEARQYCVFTTIHFYVTEGYANDH